MNALHAKAAPRTLAERDEPVLQALRGRAKPTFGIERMRVRKDLLVEVHELIACRNDGLKSTYERLTNIG